MCCGDSVPEECCGHLPDAPHARQCEELQAKLLPDLGARKVQVKLTDGSQVRECKSGRTRTELDMGHDVFFSRSDRNIKAYAYHKGSGTKLELERVIGVFELPVELVPYGQSVSKNGTSGPCSSLSALEQIEDMMVRVATVDHPN